MSEENKKTNIESKLENEAKTLITKIILNNFDKMDTNNKAAAKVLVQKSPEECRDFMMSSAGFDYSRMRSMYG